MKMPVKYDMGQTHKQTSNSATAQPQSRNGMKRKQNNTCQSEFENFKDVVVAQKPLSKEQLLKEQT